MENNLLNKRKRKIELLCLENKLVGKDETVVKM